MANITKAQIKKIETIANKLEDLMCDLEPDYEEQEAVAYIDEALDKVRAALDILDNLE